MRNPTAPWALAAALVFGAPPAMTQSARAQEPRGGGESDAERLDRLERRMTEMETRHAEEIKARDEEIAQLRSQVGQQDDEARAGEPDDIEQTRADVLRDLESREPVPLTVRTPADINPRMAVISDFLASYSSNRENEALNRVDVREVELDLRAAVDPRADGVAILAFERDAENPVFPEDEPPEGPESSVNVEEAYLFLHDFGVPNLTAKLGRFHVRFGRQNMLHLHDLPTVDPPLVNQAFLAPESLTDGGLSLSYLIPNPADVYLEAVVEVISGEGAGSESPTLAGDLSVDSPAVNAHLLWNTDLGPDWNLELGGSALAGHADADNARDVRLYGADVTLIRTDPTGGFNNQLVQAELIFGDVDQEDGGSSDSVGAYVLGQQQISKDVYAGLRLDWTEDANDDQEEAWAVSPYVSWYWSEFLRFRIQYQHKDGDVGSEDNLYLQATWIFGAHPPHPYWSMR